MTTEPAWTRREQAVFDRLDSPRKVQRYLDALTYSTDPDYRSPRHVIRTRRAHCFDGALLAAAALRMLGFPPLIMDLVADRDDDHVVAVYRAHGGYGTVAKSNFAGLRGREPVYRSLRELAMSYFEHYYNFQGEKTLRNYSVLMDLACYDHLDWMVSDRHLDDLAERLDGIRHYRLLSDGVDNELSLVDRRSFAAGLRGANPAAISGVAPRYRKALRDG